MFRSLPIWYSTAHTTTIIAILIFWPSNIHAGFGSGTDPFGFGNVAETCKLPPFVSQNFIPNWNDFSRLYYVMMSKEHVTRFTQRLHNSSILPHVTIKDLKRACFILDQIPPSPGDSRHRYTAKGFDSKSMELSNYPLGFPGLLRFDKTAMDEDSGGISQLSISNNFSFNVGVICWDDGVGTWIVNSPNKTLNHRDKYLVTQHLAALGFNPDNFLSLDFNQCR